MTELMKFPKREVKIDMIDDEYPALSPEDQAIWDEFAADFVESVPDEEEDFETLLARSEGQNIGDESDCLIKDNEGDATEIIAPADVVKKTFKIIHDPQLDKRTAEKLRKGKMPIEARLDLHGMSREVAHEAVENFILSSAARGLRHVIIITGKGKSKSTSQDWLKQGKGILKEHTPYWLSSPKLKPVILKFMQAQPKDGGAGALYIYLKRKR